MDEILPNRRPYIPHTGKVSICFHYTELPLWGHIMLCLNLFVIHLLVADCSIFLLTQLQLCINFII